MIKLLRCSKCGKIFKIVNTTAELSLNLTLQDIQTLIHHTDLGGEITQVVTYEKGLDNNSDYIKCINCDEISHVKIINIDDWVADKVFTVKGEKNI